MLQKDVLDLGHPAGHVDLGDPIVAPPIGEEARIVEAEDVDVSLVDEVVRQDCHVATRMARADHSDVGWVVPLTGYEMVMMMVVRMMMMMMMILAMEMIIK